MQTCKILMGLTGLFSTYFTFPFKKVIFAILTQEK
jgi:hypothetical protein